MSDYRRLISYIYEYEGKEKGKNVGFVKLEARNGQCRLNLSVKKVYMGSSAIGVFLLSKAGTEVFLGNIFTAAELESSGLWWMRKMWRETAGDWIHITG